MKKDKTWRTEDRCQALKRLYSKWAQYETWDLSACGCLVAGIDPSFTINATGPLTPIEKTSIGMIDALIQSAAGASLETLETDYERVLRSTFLEWAKVHLDPFLLTEFRLTFLGESDKSIAAGVPWQKKTQIKGPKARRNRLLKFLETKNIKTDPLSITKEELHQRFYDEYPDIFEVKLSTFEGDLKKLKIKGKSGRPESF